VCRLSGVEAEGVPGDIGDRSFEETCSGTAVVISKDGSAARDNLLRDEQ
jgi:hypothetical protein